MTTKRQLTPIGKRIAPQLEELRFLQKHNLFAYQPIGDILSGILLDGTGWPTLFRVWALPMVLFVPRDTLDLSCGEMLKNQAGSTEWDIEAPDLVDGLVAAIRAVGLPYLAKYDTAAAIPTMFSAQSIAKNIRNAELVASCHARAGAADRAIPVIDAAIEGAAAYQHIDWVPPLTDRLGELRTHLRQDPARAQQLLDGWKSETVSALGLGSRGSKGSG